MFDYGFQSCVPDTEFIFLFTEDIAQRETPLPVEKVLPVYSFLHLQSIWLKRKGYCIFPGNQTADSISRNLLNTAIAHYELPSKSDATINFVRDEISKHN